MSRRQKEAHTRMKVQRDAIDFDHDLPAVHYHELMVRLQAGTMSASFPIGHNPKPGGSAETFRAMMNLRYLFGICRHFQIV